MSLEGESRDDAGCARESHRLRGRSGGGAPKKLTNWTMSYVIGSKLQRRLKGMCSTPEE